MRKCHHWAHIQWQSITTTTVTEAERRNTKEKNCFGWQWTRYATHKRFTNKCKCLTDGENSCFFFLYCLTHKQKRTKICTKRSFKSLHLCLRRYFFIVFFFFSLHILLFLLTIHLYLSDYVRQQNREKLISIIPDEFTRVDLFEW